MSGAVFGILQSAIGIGFGCILIVIVQELIRGNVRFPRPIKSLRAWRRRREWEGRR